MNCAESIYRTFYSLGNFLNHKNYLKKHLQCLFLSVNFGYAPEIMIHAVKAALPEQGKLLYN